MAIDDAASAEGGDSAASATSAIRLTPLPFSGHAQAASASESQRRERTNHVRVAILGRLRALARARGDKAIVARVARAEARELERHRACTQSPAPTTADELRGTRFETSPCAGNDDGTGPYDARAIAAAITQAMALAELERIEDVLELPH